MKSSRAIHTLAMTSVAFFAASAGSVAFAEDQASLTGQEETTTIDPNDSENPPTLGEGQASDRLPAPRSDSDPQPPVPAPRLPASGVVKQAGTGGQTAYGRAGVLELGGSAAFARASDFTQVTLNPSIGWFFVDNFEGSVILALSHLNASGIDTTLFSLLLEPSFHLPMSETLFGFVGLGAGPSWATGPGLGFALTPRIGLNALVGRSGILTPSFYVQYSTHDAIQTPSGAYLAVALSFGAGIGYTVMW